MRGTGPVGAAPQPAPWTARPGKDRYSPSFWTRKRLTKIDTSVLTGAVYKPVDTWALSDQFPSTGDGTDPALRLASITRTGHTGTGDSPCLRSRSRA